MLTSTSSLNPSDQSINQTSTGKTSPGWFYRLLKTLDRWFIENPEPRITRITDGVGQTWWKAYNPSTRQLQWLESETEALLWLDSQPTV